MTKLIVDTTSKACYLEDFDTEPGSYTGSVVRKSGPRLDNVRFNRNNVLYAHIYGNKIW